MKRLILVLGLMALTGCLKSSNQIRVHNLTEFDFSAVTVMAAKFDSVKSGALTEYQSVPAVFED